MRRIRIGGPGFAALALLALVAAAVGFQNGGQNEPLTVKSAPPVVVKTVPQSGDTQVDAAKVTEISVTFSKDMIDKSWSWSTASEDTAVEVADIRYAKDQRTCTAKVKLEPGRTYAIWLNSGRFHGFQDTVGHPAVPYLLIFETKAK